MGQGERKSGVRAEKTVRRLNKGKKSSNSLQLNVPLGGVREGESRRRTKGYELTILVQGCRFTATEQRERHAYCCSHVSVPHFPFLLIRSEVFPAVLFLFQLLPDKYFPLVFLRGKVPGVLDKYPRSPQSHGLTSPARFHPRFHCVDALQMKAVLRNCQHF